MKEDEQSQINKIFKNIPKRNFNKKYKVVGISTEIFAGEVHNVIKLLSKMAKSYKIDRNYEEIKHLEFEDLLPREVGYKDKMKNIETLNGKLQNKELKKNDVICFQLDILFGYIFLKNKSETLKEIKSFKHIKKEIEEDL